MKNFKIKPYSIGFRTIKTAAGMTLGILLAKLIGLENYASAAILVVLCIKNTKVKSVEAATARLFACLLAILFSFVFFETLGYYAVVLGLLVLLFIPVTVMFGIQEGVVTACVIILHCFNSKDITPALMLNEVELLFIGLGIGLVLNLYMPSRNKELEDYKVEIEREFKVILSEFSEALKMTEVKLETGEIDKLHALVERAKSSAFIDVENHFVRNENSYYHYFDMRGEQVELLYRMADLINEMSDKDKLHLHCSEMLKDMSRSISSNDYTMIRLHNLYDLKLHLEDYPLPETMDSLYSRAAAIQLINELETYLKIKSNFGSLKKV